MYAKFYTEEQMKNYTENKQKIEKAKLRKMKEEKLLIRFLWKYFLWAMLKN